MLVNQSTKGKQMPGKHITNQQVNLYMNNRQQGQTQIQSAAKAGISERSGRKIEHQGGTIQKCKRSWRTRKDPLENVWEEELEPLLKSTPQLSPISLLEHLQEKYPEKYPDKILRTLERRVKHWLATQGPAKEVMFLQKHPIGKQGISDFTQLKKVEITIAQKPFKHLLYHFRLSHSGWSHMKVIQGGESYTALAEGLQEALWQIGGSPLEHRTDSLSAAFKNLSKSDADDATIRYDQLCKHYEMIATRNNRGKGHENGSIESPHGHIKKRIKQALLLRGSNDFASIEDYQEWLRDVVKRHNKRNAPNAKHEFKQLQPLPAMRTTDYTEIAACVSSSATIDVRRSTYSVPSRLIESRLKIHLYDDRLECYLGATLVQTLKRVFSNKNNGRGSNINYHHMVDSLVKKPQAFRLSHWRDEMLPGQNYRLIWEYINKNYQGHLACKLIVGILYLASKHNCELRLGEYIVEKINLKQALSLPVLQQHFVKKKPPCPQVEVRQHDLSDYNKLISSSMSAEIMEAV